MWLANPVAVTAAINREKNMSEQNAIYSNMADVGTYIEVSP